MGGLVAHRSSIRITDPVNTVAMVSTATFIVSGNLVGYLPGARTDQMYLLSLGKDGRRDKIDVNAPGRGLSALSDISDRLSQFAHQPLQTLILICALIP